jgi:hypothetical protein
VKEADIVQDMLMEFMYSEKLAVKLSKEHKVRPVVLISPEVDNLYRVEKRKKSTEDAFKRVALRKNSAQTAESERSCQ